MSEDGEGWVKAWDKVKERWYECAVGIVCPCGAELVVSDQNEQTECKCGRVYQLQSPTLLVKEPNP